MLWLCLWTASSFAQQPPPETEAQPPRPDSGNPTDRLAADEPSAEPIPADTQAAPQEGVAADEPSAEPMPADTRAAPQDGLAADEPSPTPSSSDTSDTKTAPEPSTPPESEEQAKARRAVARGETLFAAGNFGAAISEFRQAYYLLQGDPRQYLVLNNIAVCHERLFHYDLALQFYERYLSEGGPSAEDRAEVAAVIRTLRSLLVTLNITSNVPAEVWVDDRHVGDAPGHVLVSAGKHLVELRAPVYESSLREVQVSTGQTIDLSFELQGLSQFSGLSPAYFWVGTGLTAAALATGAVLGVEALSQDSAAHHRADRSPYLNREEDVERMQRIVLAADLAFGAAAIFAVSSAVLFFLTDWQADERPDSPPGSPNNLIASRKSVTPLVTPTSWGLRLQEVLP